LNEKKKIRGVSKAEWLQAAMEVLSQKGVDSLSVEGLARDLGISKSGFYWQPETSASQNQVFTGTSRIVRICSYNYSITGAMNSPKL
jgi:hypothetical protein